MIFRYDQASNTTIRKIGNRAPVGSDDELMQTINAMTSDYKKAGKSEFPVLLDALPDVPWQDVIHVMDLCKQNNCERIEFTAPYEMGIPGQAPK